MENNNESQQNKNWWENKDEYKNSSSSSSAAYDKNTSSADKRDVKYLHSHEKEWDHGKEVKYLGSNKDASASSSSSNW